MDQQTIAAYVLLGGAVGIGLSCIMIASGKGRLLVALVKALNPRAKAILVALESGTVDGKDKTPRFDQHETRIRVLIAWIDEQLMLRRAAMGHDSGIGLVVRDDDVSYFERLPRVRYGKLDGHIEMYRYSGFGDCTNFFDLGELQLKGYRPFYDPKGTNGSTPALPQWMEQNH